MRPMRWPRKYMHGSLMYWCNRLMIIPRQHRRRQHRQKENNRTMLMRTIMMMMIHPTTQRANTESFVCSISLVLNDSQSIALNSSLSITPMNICNTNTCSTILSNSRRNTKPRALNSLTFVWWTIQTFWICSKIGWAFSFHSTKNVSAPRAMTNRLSTRLRSSIKITNASLTRSYTARRNLAFDTLPAQSRTMPPSLWSAIPTSFPMI
mmetsp:Transcript_20314/g.33628  ORF Transcript_20314/g.33628 Transcript_20314/m.33628 type:complete len:208 (-) Transcript_20314:481-1104(-)